MKIHCKERYLVFPVSYTARIKRVEFRENGRIVYDLDIALDAVEPDYEAFVDMERFMGRELELSVVPDMALQWRTSSEAPIPCNDRYRPHYHYSPAQGWLNDPNGLIYYNGFYHMFHQYNPVNFRWGNMHWYHAVSRDLLHWEQRGIALFPDEHGTMYSGSAIVDTDNRTGLKSGDHDPLLLFYTAAGGTSALSQGKLYTQCMAYSTDGGVTFHKYEKNPILPHLIEENRDPKIIYHAATNRYIMALYLQGDIFALFASDNLIEWEQIQTLSLPGDTECPDFYPLFVDGDRNKERWVMTGAADRYWIGAFDGYRFIPEGAVGRLHYGANSYASQSFTQGKPGDDRRIRIAWNNAAPLPAPFSQSMNIPCEMSLRTIDGSLMLCANPLKELSHQYEAEESIASIRIQKTVCLARLQSRAYDIDIVLRPGKASATTIALLGMYLRMDFERNLLFCGENTAPLWVRNGCVHLRLLSDTTVLEIFLDEGQAFMACGCVTDPNLNALEISASEGAVLLERCSIRKVAEIW